MKFLIKLFRVVDENCGDSTLVWMGNDRDDFEVFLKGFCDMFKSSKTFIQLERFYNSNTEQTTAYISYSFNRE